MVIFGGGGGGVLSMDRCVRPKGINEDGKQEKLETVQAHNSLQRSEDCMIQSHS